MKVYLDNAATTPIAKEVIKVLVKLKKSYGKQLKESA